MACNKEVMRHDIYIHNDIALLYSVDLVKHYCLCTYKAKTFIPIRLEFARSISSLPSHNITSFSQVSAFIILLFRPLYLLHYIYKVTIDCILVKACGPEKKQISTTNSTLTSIKTSNKTFNFKKYGICQGYIIKFIQTGSRIY